MRLNPQFILRKVADETLLISIQDISAPKRLLILNDLASDIYSLLQQGKDIDEIYSVLLQEYDVAPEVLKRDLDDFLSELRSYGALMD